MCLVIAYVSALWVDLYNHMQYVLHKLYIKMCFKTLSSVVLTNIKQVNNKVILCLCPIFTLF